VQDSSTNDVLWQRARNGDREAFGQLAEEYRPYLRTVAERMLAERSPGEASDVVQDGLLLAFENRVQCQSTSVAGFVAWVTAIVRHRAVKVLSGADFMLPLPSEVEGLPEVATQSTGPEERTMRRERAARLLAAVAQLPEDYRQVIDLRHRHMLPFAEVAQRMGRSCGAVRQLWVRALDRLRALLGEEP
jgi:RNA polymerase sigma-70 factor (ECF subfamily)